MANRVLILRWAGSAYDSLGGFLELTAKELTAMGFAVTFFAADGPEWPKQLVQLLQQNHFGFALTMSGIGADLTMDGKSVWEATKTLLFNWNCDHACYFPSRHGIRTPFVLHGYVFPDHARYNIQHLAPNGAAFAVHLGIPPRCRFPGAPQADRNGRIMFTKSGADTDKIEAAWRNYNPDLRKILFTAAEELFAAATGDFLPALQRIAEPLGLFLGGNSRLTLQLIRELDAYIRFKRANLVMRSILRFPVDVFGSGWDHIDFDGQPTRFFGPATLPSLLEQLPTYTGCLSTNPLIEHSAHDRVFFSLAAGVTPVTDSNAFIGAQMPQLAPYTFSFTRERIQSAVEALIDDPAEAAGRTEATWAALATPFGLRRSAEQIVQFVMLHGLNARCGG